RGFGRSSGIPSLGGVVADGISAARHHEEIKPAGLPSILYGFSLGGAVAAQVVLHHKFEGLILQSTFTNLRDLARVNFPRVPLHLFAGDVFDTLRVIRTLDIPLLVLHGTADATCPSWMAEALYEASPSPKWIRTVEGGLHKDLFFRARERMVTALREFSARIQWSAPPQSLAGPRRHHVVDVAFRYVRRYLRRGFQHQSL
ncbi:MAG: alpha/beta hydrolase, partial [Acidobacteriota bacterium]